MMDNRWFLDEKLQFETTDVKAMNFWSLKTRFYVTMENRWFLDENFQFEGNGSKSDVLLVSKHSFQPYNGKPMVS